MGQVLGGELARGKEEKTKMNRRDFFTAVGLLSLLGYVNGDYNDAATFKALKKALGDARRPAYYLAIPPALFATVIKGLGAARLAQ